MFSSTPTVLHMSSAVPLPSPDSMSTRVTAPVPVPEGTIARKPLHFFWLADHSGSMRGRKIATLNQAIREAVPEVRKAVSAYPEVIVHMRAIRFADRAEWHVGPAPVPVDQFVWPELDALGATSTAQAIRLLTEELTLERMPRRGYPPVCILISDGYCTESTSNYTQAIADLLALPWGQKSVRLAIAIGDPSEYDEQELIQFVSHPEIGVLKADSPQSLVGYIKWASVSATVGASQSKSRGRPGEDAHNVNLAQPPAVPTITSSIDEF
jgi:uncharacterized protein YegL